MASLAKALLLKVPIIQSPMAGIFTLRMAAAVTNNGGLGSLPFGATDLTQVATIKKQLEEFTQLTGNYKVNLNFFCHDIQPESTPAQNKNWEKLFEDYKYDKSSIKFTGAKNSFRELEKDSNLFQEFIGYIDGAKPAILSFHFGIPNQSSIDHIHRAGSLVFISVTSVDEARAAFDAGADGVICQGYEAGGHRGNFLADDAHDEKLTTNELFSRVKQANFADSKYIVPAGGIMNSDGIKQYMLQGASAVQMGTIFLFSEDSNSHPFIKTIDKLATTVMTSIISGRTARCIETPFIKNVNGKFTASGMEMGSLPPYGCSYSAYKSFKLTQAPDCGFYLAGANWRLISDKNTQEILQQLQNELSA